MTWIYRQEDWVGARTKAASLKRLAVDALFVGLTLANLGFSLGLLAKIFGKQFRPYCEKLEEADFQY
jgi:hypothetical protein